MGKGETVVEQVGSSVKALMASAAVLGVLFLGASAGLPSQADAATSNFCGGWLGGYGTCNGNGRTVYATEGWGDQHSMCVWAADLPGGGIQFDQPMCSGGPGQHVYNPTSTHYAYPSITNNSCCGNNLVHGIAYQP